ncbi:MULTISPECIES: helix-turn-helix transcriptional regulator [Prauserella salsuginis group]|uniref:Helix-turn-helix transcriptional regulator n=1 Tax=Prauserella salsuginis TaxID=387889 RepID=A0ABW6GB19_9PSEU|nr:MULTISPECIES: WYL domain-containing protein [Prauserella salsuginis group]MCR3722341.1 putative DNA-binding transcriptional regulator YafY, contains an HTH and WYL domains [Prauserella flava]MCR3736783.1 putative DNA-binding transcriptional regulator YafY, contains an HTH and WYL domains [Prauserella salsuginis]
MSVRQEMPGRLLRLLALLQSRREWPGGELAERVGVTTRTLRRDIDRLRALDYPVESTGGTGGGYRLGRGGRLPPLVLDDDEAVAVGVALAAAASVTPDLGESATRALAKLGQVLPARLRPRLAAAGSIVAAPPRGVPADDLPDGAHADGPARDADAGLPGVDPDRLALLAAACRDAEVVSLRYVSKGRDTARRVEPHRLVLAEGRWYLSAHDLVRDAARIFRLDRMHDVAATGRRFASRPQPEDAVAQLRESFAAATYRHTAHVTIELPESEARRWVPALPGEVVAEGPDRCRARISADSAPLVVQYTALLTAVAAARGAAVTVDAEAAVAEPLRSLGTTLTAIP